MFAHCLFIDPNSTLSIYKFSVSRGAGPYRGLGLWLDLMSKDELAAIPYPIEQVGSCNLECAITAIEQ